MFLLFCGGYEIRGQLSLDSRKAKFLVGSELEIAKKIVREKDARFC